MRILLSLLLLAAILPTARAQEDPKAALKAQLERIQALRQQRPNDGLLAYYQAMTHGQLGERDAALHELESLLGRRLGLVPVEGIGFEALWADAQFQALRRRLADEEPATPAAPVALRLRDPALIPEGIAYSAKRRTVYVSSIAQRKIVAVDASGQVRDFTRPGDKLDAVLGLTVDAPRDRLCAVSTNGFLEEAQRARRNAVACFMLRSGRLQARFEAPDAAQLNDLVVLQDGTVYVTDSQSGSLFRARPGERSLGLVGTRGALRGVNGIAAAPDGALYVALSTGIGRVDGDTGEALRLPQPDDVVTGGIDGLYWHEGALVGVQNVTNPGRVIRIALADGGRRIGGLTVLQSHHHPALAEPTTGAIVGDRLYVIANSHVGRYRPDGSLQEPQTLKPTAIIAVPLRG